jgi:very-short-patch-repair endonuclease
MNTNFFSLNKSVFSLGNPATERVWSAVRSNQCMWLGFQRNEAFGKYIADFYCAALKLVLEIGEKNASKECRQLEEKGLQVIRLPREFVLKASDEQIRQAIQLAIAAL